MINFLKNFTRLLKFKKNEKRFKRVIFNENLNTFKYLDRIIKRDKPGTCVISLENISNNQTTNTKYFHLNNFFILSLFFIFLKTKYVYASTPDLNFTIFRKSIHKKSKYIYIQHSPVSLSMAYKEKAFINFNAVQVVNKNQYTDLLDINKLFNKNIKPIKSKYLFLENLLLKNKKSGHKIDYLIAPTWNTDFYKLNIHKKIFEILSELNKTFVFRPHYMSIKKNEFLLKDLNLAKDKIDLKSDLNFENYENLISDWSGIYLEFAFIKKRKPILINTKMKIRNKNYKKFRDIPIELKMREELSIQFDFDSLRDLKKFIKIEDKTNQLIGLDNLNKLMY